MHRSSLGLSLVLVTGCPSEDLCVEYVDAFEACVAEAEANGETVDADDPDPDVFCEDYRATPDSGWRCLRDTFAEGDCSTAQSIKGLVIESTSCELLSGD